MIKAIFFDIDGTLVSFKTHKIPQSTIDSLRQLKNNNIKLFIATGRPIFHLKKLISEVGDLFDGYLTFNGQYCLNNQGKVIHEEYINKNDLTQFVEFIKTTDIACGFIEKDYFYFNLENERMQMLNKTLGDTAPERIFDDMNRVLTHNTYQLNIFLNEDEEQMIMSYLPNCKSVRWCPYFTDIIPKNGGKATGIHKILDYYNLTIDESMAFGDGGNDFEMLDAVKIGVAMGNANEHLKEIADYITLDVDNNGITHALKHFKLL